MQRAKDQTSVHDKCTKDKHWWIDLCKKTFSLKWREGCVIMMIMSMIHFYYGVLRSSYLSIVVKAFVIVHLKESKQFQLKKMERRSNICGVQPLYFLLRSDTLKLYRDLKVLAWWICLDNSFPSSHMLNICLFRGTLLWKGMI